MLNIWQTDFRCLSFCFLFIFYILQYEDAKDCFQKYKCLLGLWFVNSSCTKNTRSAQQHVPYTTGVHPISIQFNTLENGNINYYMKVRVIIDEKFLSKKSSLVAYKAKSFTIWNRWRICSDQTVCVCMCMRNPATAGEYIENW